jgi:isopenicillin N synthase-like dioxygenase
MWLPPEERFETFHQMSEDSNSVLVLLRYPYVPHAEQSKIVGHNKHTDIGSITVLFTDQWGLQVMAADSQRWEFVAPRPGCAIINIGDSLRFLSQKKLRSCLHRVVPVDGQTSDRYTIAYFLRPDNRVSFIDSNGVGITAKQWHDAKYEVFRATHEEQRRDTILTGGLEHVEISGAH